MQSADSVFKNVGSDGDVRAVVITTATPTAHSRPFTTCGPLSSRPCRGRPARRAAALPARQPSAVPGEPTRARVREASPTCAVSVRRRVLTAGPGAQAAAVPARRSRRPQSRMFFAAHDAPAPRVLAEPAGAERDRRRVAVRRPSVHILLAICSRSALRLRDAAATPGGHGAQARPLSSALRAPLL